MRILERGQIQGGRTNLESSEGILHKQDNIAEVSNRCLGVTCSDHQPEKTQKEVERLADSLAVVIFEELYGVKKQVRDGLVKCQYVEHIVVSVENFAELAQCFDLETSNSANKALLTDFRK